MKKDNNNKDALDLPFVIQKQMKKIEENVLHRLFVIMEHISVHGHQIRNVILDIQVRQQTVDVVKKQILITLRTIMKKEMDIEAESLLKEIIPHQPPHLQHQTVNVSYT